MSIGKHWHSAFILCLPAFFSIITPHDNTACFLLYVRQRAAHYRASQVVVLYGGKEEEACATNVQHTQYFSMYLLGGEEMMVRARFARGWTIDLSTRSQSTRQYFL